MERRLLAWAVLTALLAVQGCERKPLAPSQNETLAMLNSGQFTELDRRFSAIQEAYDKDTITDEELRAAFRAFYATNPALEVQYSGWLTMSPRSYVAHLAVAFTTYAVASRNGDCSLSMRRPRNNSKQLTYR